MGEIQKIVEKAVDDYYHAGPRHEGALAGQIIAALGLNGFWISDDVTPWSNQAVAMNAELSKEIEKLDLREWAGSNLLRQRQVDEIVRLQKRAEKIALRLTSQDRV